MAQPVRDNVKVKETPDTFIYFSRFFGNTLSHNFSKVVTISSDPSKKVPWLCCSACSVPSRTSRIGLVVISMLAHHANSIHVIHLLTLNTLLSLCSTSSHSAQSLCEQLTFTANSSLFSDGESLRAAMLPNYDGQPHTDLMTYLR